MSGFSRAASTTWTNTKSKARFISQGLQLGKYKTNRHLQQIKGQNFEVFSSEQSQQSIASRHFLIVPGNPGYGAYYQGLVRELTDVHGHDSSAEACSLQGHSPLYSASQDNSKLPGLDAQIDALATLVSHRMSTSPESTVTLVSHSIGGHISMEAALKLFAQDKDVAKRLKVVLVAPFLKVDFKQPNQRKMWWVAHLPGVLALILSIYQRLPASMRLHHQQHVLGMREGYALAATRRLLTAPISLACTHMGRQEFAQLDRPLEDLEKQVRAVSDVGMLSGVVTGKVDAWFPEQHRNVVSSVIGDEKIHIEEELPHAFCVTVKHSRACAHAIQKLQSS